MGFQTPEEVHVDSYHLVDIQNVFDQVHLWKTCHKLEDRLLAGVVIWIWHSVCYSKSYKRQCGVKVPHTLTNGKLPTHAVWVPHENIMVLKDNKVIGNDEGPEPGARWKLAFGWRLKFPWAWDWSCLNISEKWLCSLHSKVVVWLHEQHGRIWSVHHGHWSFYWLKIKILEAYGDSTLVIYQVKG